MSAVPFVFDSLAHVASWSDWGLLPGGVASQQQPPSLRAVAFDASFVAWLQAALGREQAPRDGRIDALVAAECPELRQLAASLESWLTSTRQGGRSFVDGGATIDDRSRGLAEIIVTLLQLHRDAMTTVTELERRDRGGTWRSPPHPRRLPQHQLYIVQQFEPSPGGRPQTTPRLRVVQLDVHGTPNVLPISPQSFATLLLQDEAADAAARALQSLTDARVELGCGSEAQAQFSSLSKSFHKGLAQNVVAKPDGEDASGKSTLGSVVSAILPWMWGSAAKKTPPEGTATQSQREECLGGGGGINRQTALGLIRKAFSGFCEAGALFSASVAVARGHFTLPMAAGRCLFPPHPSLASDGKQHALCCLAAAASTRCCCC